MKGVVNYYTPKNHKNTLSTTIDNTRFIEGYFYVNSLKWRISDYFFKKVLSYYSTFKSPLKTILGAYFYMRGDMMNLFNIDNDIDYILSQAGKEIKINNVPTTAIIGSMSDNIEYDDKKIITKTSISRGSEIEYDNYKYIILSEINGKRFDTYYKGIMRRYNYNIKFNFNGTVKEFPAIIETKMLDIETGQYLSLPVGKILVTMQDNAETQPIKIQDKFIKMNSAWEIKGIDKSKVGLIILHCEKTDFTATDDVENEIIDGLILPQYSVSILNGDSATVGVYPAIKYRS